MNRATLLLGALVSGLLFGLGLALSQMTNPQKIKDFLDFAAIPGGGWDPSLAFVMGGGVLVAFFGLRAARRGQTTVVDVEKPPTAIDRPLIIGAAIFGIGWGLSGFCPGPALADLGLIPQAVALFVVAMLAGSWATGWVIKRPGRAAASSANALSGS